MAVEDGGGGLSTATFGQPQQHPQILHDGLEHPRPKRLPRQALEFENKLKSFLCGSGGFGDGGGKKPGGGKGGRKRR